MTGSDNTPREEGATVSAVPMAGSDTPEDDGAAVITASGML